MERFADDDAGYVAWSAAHPDGFVVNCFRRPSSDYLVLHRADCRHITEHTKGHERWTHDYIKVVSWDRGELLMWCYQEAGGAPSQCPHCDPMGERRPTASVTERRTTTLSDTPKNRRAFLDRMREASEVETAVAERLMEWSAERGLRPAYTAPKGKPAETFVPLVTDRGLNVAPFGVSVGDRRVFVAGSTLKTVRPFSSAPVYDDLLKKVLAVPGMVPTEKDLYPNIRLSDLEDPAAWSAFVDVMGWVIDELRK